MVKIIILFLLIISNGNAKDGPSFEITKITATEEEIIIHGAQLENIERVSLRSLNKEILKSYQVNTASGEKVTAHNVDERPLPLDEYLYLVVKKIDGVVSYPIAITSQGDKKVFYKISRKKKIKSPKNIEVDEKSVINFYPSQDYSGYDYDYTILTNSTGDLVIKGFDKTLFVIDQFGNLEISGTLKVKGKAVEDLIVPYAPIKNDLRISNVIIGEDNSISGVTTFSSSGNMDVATGTFHVDSANGRVGIGNATPTYKLDVQGATNSGIRLRQAAVATNTSGAYFNGLVFEDPGNKSFGIGYGAGDLFSINSFDGSTYRNIFSLNNVGDGVILGSLKIGAYTLPAADGASDTILKTNGAGVVSWTTAGNGDVVGPASSTDGNFAIFNGTTGKVVRDSGFASNILNGVTVMLNVSTAANNLIVSDSASSRLLKDSRISLDNIPKMATPSTKFNQIIISAGNFGKDLTTTVYPIPETIGASGTVLKSDGANAIWEVDAGVRLNGTYTNAQNHVAKFINPEATEIGDSGIDVISLVRMEASPTGANYPLVTMFAGDKGVQPATYQIPPTVGSATYVLKSDGTNVVWQEDAGAASLKLTKWTPFTAYETDEIQFAGEDSNWLIRTATNTISSDAWWKDQNTGKSVPIAPPLVTTGVIKTAGVSTMTGSFVTVQAGTGYIADYFESDSPYPVFKVLTWPQTTIDLSAQPQGPYTIYIDNTGIPKAVAGYQTPEFLNQNISIALADTYFGTIYDSQTFPTNPVGQIRELALYLGGLTKGLKYKSNGANTQVSRSAYQLYYFGINTSTNSLRPNTKDIAAQTPMSFKEFTRMGPVSQTSKTSINTSVYDDGDLILGSLENNKYGFARFYADANGEDIVMYSQNSGYAGLAEAEKAALDPDFVVPEQVSKGYIFNGYVAYEKGTNLNNSLYTFYSCNPFPCESGGGSPGSSTLLRATLGPTSSVPNRLAIFGDDSGRRLIQSDFAIPSSPGTAGQVLATNGDGTTSWATPGGGDVVGTASSTVDNLASFSDGSGKAIKDSGIATANIPTMGPVATASNQIIISAGAGGKQFTTTLYPIADTIGTAGMVLKSDGANAIWQEDVTQGPNDIQGPASASSTNLASFNGPTGKIIQDSGVAVADLVTKLTDFSAADRVVLANGANKILDETGYTIPKVICPVGQVLKSDGINMTCQVEIPLTTWVAGKDYKVGEIVNTGSDANWLFKVVQDHTSVDVPIDFRLGRIKAIAPPIITTGVQDGGQASLAGNETTVQSGTGYIAKYGTSPSAWPLITIVEWTTQTITLPATGIHTLFITEQGQLISVAGLSTRSAQDDTISVGLVDMDLRKIYDRETYPTNPVGQLRGLAFFFGGMTKGLSYTPSVTKELARTAYDVHFWGANSADPYDPNTKSYNAKNPVQFYEFKQNGPVLPAVTKTQLRNVWDNNGTLTNLGNKKWGFARIYSSLDEEDYVMYGQVEYIDEAAAKAGAVSKSFIRPTELSLTKFSSYITFQEGDNDFSNNQVTTCEPFGCDKIGSAAGGGGGAGDVLGPSTSVAGNLPKFVDNTGKVLEDSGIVAANIPTMASATAANQIIISTGAGKQLTTTLYPIPTAIGASGTVLKSDGTNATWETDFGGTGDVVGPVGPTTANRPAVFADSLGKILSEAPFTLPITAGTTGQVLGLTGVATANWVDAGNVVGPANAEDTNLASFNGITGKLIKDSGLLTANIPTMAANGVAGNLVQTAAANKALSNSGIAVANVVTKSSDFTAANRAVLAGGNNRTLTETAYTLPTADGTANYVLKTNGSGTVAWAADTSSGGDVVGPASSTDFAIARFDLGTGKLIQGSGVLVDDSNNLSGILNISIGGAATINGALTINNNGTNSSAFPTGRGNAGQALITNGSGTLSWSTPVSSLNSQAGSYTLSNTDCGNSVTLNNASATNLSLSALPVGCIINVFQGGAGVITVITGGGMSPQNAFGLFRTRTQYSVIGIQVMSASVAIISGDVN